MKKYREVLAGGDQALAAGEYPEIQKRIDKAVTKVFCMLELQHATNPALLQPKQSFRILKIQ